jgi:2-dehydro-3-deoxygluconokinase
MNDKKYAVTLGEYMLRLRAPGFERLFQSSQLEATFGGAEANVAVSLANYEQPVRYVSAFPPNDIGEGALKFLHYMGVDTSCVIRQGNRLGTYYVETGSGPRPSKVIYDRAHSAISEAKFEDFNWDKIFDNASWLHTTGITPAISESAANLTLKTLKLAKEKNIQVSMDLNFRKKLWQWGKSSVEVMPDIVSLIDVVIANEEDIQTSLGIELDQKIGGEALNREKYHDLGKLVLEKFPNLKMVAITLRESFSATHNDWGAILIVRGEENPFISKKYQLKNIVDRVGGGDSFGGGLIYSLINEYSYQSSIEFAVAASALKHTIVGDANRVSVEEVNRLMGGDASGRVQR